MLTRTPTKCPVCGGAGKLPVVLAGGTGSIMQKCHGCDGDGWVFAEVEDTPQVFPDIFPLSVPYQPPYFCSILMSESPFPRL